MLSIPRYHEVSSLYQKELSLWSKATSSRSSTLSLCNLQRLGGLTVSGGVDGLGLGFRGFGGSGFRV